MEYEWIKENIKLGRLVEKASPIISKLYFRGRKGLEKKRVIIDYQPVNFRTIRDHNCKAPVGFYIQPGCLIAHGTCLCGCE
jgi:hypothetical protein